MRFCQQAIRAKTLGWRGGNLVLRGRDPFVQRRGRLGNRQKNSRSSFKKGAFHSTQNSRNFGWFIKWNGPFRFGPTEIFGTSFEVFEGGPLWPVWSLRSVGPKCRFPFAKIVVPSTALFHPVWIFCTRILSGSYAILTSPNSGDTAVYGYNPALF